jgi:hypothetical protein
MMVSADFRSVESINALYSWLWHKYMLVWHFKALLNVINIFNTINEITLSEILDTFSPYFVFRDISENKFLR